MSWVDSPPLTAEERLVNKAKDSVRYVKNELTVTAREGAVLSAAQLQFNKLMKHLENARVKLQREQTRLDALSAHCVKELMPLVAECHRLNFQLVTAGFAAWKTVKLTARRREALGDLLCGKAHEVISDSSGLTEEQVEQIKRVIEELDGPISAEEIKSREEVEFDYLRSMMEGVARRLV